MKWKINLPDSMELVYYVVKFTGLAPFTLKNNTFYPPTRLDKLYSVITAAAYSLMAMIAFSIFVNRINSFSSFVMIWTLIVRAVSPASVVFTPVIFLCMQKKIVYLMNRLCTISNELKSLGIMQEHGKYFKNLVATTVMANAALSVVYVALFILEPKWHVASLIQYDIENWFGLNVVLMFVQILACIRQRFKLLNERLFNLLTSVDNLGTLHQGRICVVSKNTRGEGEALTGFQRIRKIKTLHLELRDLINRATQIFAIPILLNSIQFSLRFMISSYWIYLSLHNPARLHARFIIASLLRMLIPMVILLTLAYATVITCEQGNFTRAALFKTWIKFRPPELADEFLVFSNQLFHTPITVSALGFVALDYSFLFKILSTVTTYVIVMIQFDIAIPVG